MTKVRFYEIQGLTDKDSEVIIQHAQAEIELSIDEYGRVYNEGGQYIADAKMVKA